MNYVHIIFQVVQAIIAVVLIAAVMSQTGKDQGMGGAMGGGESQGGGSRYKGGYEEKLDNTTRNLAYGFLIVSLLVAVLGRMVG
jgi:preprotein translocase subunit SecG